MTSGTAVTSLTSSSVSLATSIPHHGQKTPAEGAAIFSFGEKLASKIKTQQFVAMKELQADTMALHGQLEELSLQVAIASCPHNLQEIDSPLTWVFCFLAYVAVRTKDMETRDMLTYACLIIREDQCRGGPGWLEYDKWCCQQ